MQRIEGQLVLSPTDLTKHLACPHVTTLDLAALDDPGRGGALNYSKQQPTDDALNLVFSKGMDHERAYLQRLRLAGLVVTEIPTRYDVAGRMEAEQETLAAMRAGVDVVYQATFYDGQWGGQADFLLRSDRPSDLGDWSYDIADTKLARRLKVPALLQMATYAERLAVLQGVHPEFLTVVTGDGVDRPWRLADVASYARRARSRLRHAVTGTTGSSQPATEPVPVANCSQCRWSTRCGDLWKAADDLSLVAGMRKDHRQTLVAAGISTVADLGMADPAGLPRGIGKPSRERLVQQARLQMVGRTTGAPAYELLSPEAGKGLLGLPTPSPGDVYLDFEGDPFAHDGAGREYLAGLWDREGTFTSWWAHSFEREQALTEQLIDDLIGRLKADPAMHVYHYAAYEQSALKRLTGRHGTRETELDTLLRGERFVDLYAVVRNGIRISKGSYSIKKLEDFYWGHIRSEGSEGSVGPDVVADAMTSVVEYERFLVEGDDVDGGSAILDSIEAYNRDDVRSTHDLHAWLEQRRDELETVHGAQARPQVKDGAASDEASAAEQAEGALAERLREAGQPLLAGLVGWHRREDRPKWWEFFRVEDLDDEMLVEDGSTIGGLSAPVQVGEVKASLLWRYDFEPQDCKLSVGKAAHDVDQPQAALGQVVELDPVAGYIVLKRSKKFVPAQPRGFGSDGPINVKVLQASIARVGMQVLAGESPLGRALLERRVPPELVPPQLVPLEPQVNVGESPSDLVVRVGRVLSGQVLAVQGPPGSGKTTTGAALIRALLDDGLKVGVSALSHKVINNLLTKVDRPALEKSDGPEDGAQKITVVGTNGAVVEALSSGSANLVGGTAWLWAREDMQDLVDVLVIDEAGQFSLANAVAVSSAARSMVLFGDPQQLTQPTQAVHPDGAGISALDHLLDGHDTIPADRGVFLDKTYRMHPAITAFVSQTSYDGRLASVEGLAAQRVQADGALSGSGLRWLPVVHEGNASASDEEAAVVAELVADVCGGTWLDAKGVECRLTLDDVLVVAPYNRHVARLLAKLPVGARVGTVDKFQGQQAPVVIYSTASSSADEAPRGVDFLYDLHRLNVAVSRAKALTAIVASPDLLDAEVRTPQQFRAVNALCHYVEEATDKAEEVTDKQT